MATIDHLIAEIEERGAKEANAYLAVEKKRLEQELLVKLTQEEEQHDKNLTAKLKQLQKTQLQKKQTLQMKSRQTKLKMKQEFLKEAFGEALKEMEAWPKAQLANFATAILEAIPDEAGTLTVGEFSKALLTHEGFAKENQKRQHPLVLKEEVLPQVSGLLVQQGDIFYNGLFPELLKEVQTTASRAVMTTLFPEEKVSAYEA